MRIMMQKRRLEEQVERERPGEDSCPVCFSNFDHQTHASHMLPCGHTFCSSCLLHPSLVRCGHLCCPLCRRRCLLWQPRTQNMLRSHNTDQSLVHQQTITSGDNTGHSVSDLSHGTGVSQSELQREVIPATIQSNNTNPTERDASIISQTRAWIWRDGCDQRVRTFQSTETSQAGTTSRAIHFSTVTPSHSQLQQFFSSSAGVSELDEFLFFNRCALCYRQSFNDAHTLDCNHSLCQRCLEVLLNLASPGWVSFLYCPQCWGQTAVFQQASDNTASSSAQHPVSGESAVAEADREIREPERRRVGCCGCRASCEVM